MISELEFWIEAAAIAAVATLIPVYMGFIHVAPLGAAAYAALGGCAMALGETLQFGGHSVDAREFAIDSAAWGTGIAGVGGIAYVLALIFI